MIEDQNNSPRNPILSFFISLFVPGLGQLYNGQLKKAIVFSSVFVLIPFLFSINGFNKTFLGYFTFGLTLFLFRLFILIEATSTSKKLKRYKTTKANRWYSYTLFILSFLFLLLFYDLYKIIGVETFTTPTIANHPSMQFGDYVVADLDAYKNKKPMAGDLIVFIGNNGGKYTFRIIGVPQDSIETKNNKLYINNKEVAKSKYGESLIDNMKLNLYTERLTNGNEYSICHLNTTEVEVLPDYGPIEVPNNNYFVLGDNRDNSFDSRAIGFIPKENIKGKIMFVLWNKNLDRIGHKIR